MDNQDDWMQELQVEEPWLEDDFPRLPVSANARFVRAFSKYMASYNCKHCQAYVRGGVILICGHMFCWTCLWPFVADEPSPECPQCQTRLLLHEDIMPFYGEGPNARPEDNNDFLAEPGAVPRPSGICFTGPEEESVEEEEAADRIPPEGVPIAAPLDEEPLVQLRGIPRFHWELNFPSIEYTVTCLKWIQVICASLMLLVGCIVTMT